jgi:hypothetical protein
MPDHRRCNGQFRRHTWKAGLSKGRLRSAGEHPSVAGETGCREAEAGASRAGRSSDQGVESCMRLDEGWGVAGGFLSFSEVGFSESR